MVNILLDFLEKCEKVTGKRPEIDEDMKKDLGNYLTEAYENFMEDVKIKDISEIAGQAVYLKESGLLAEDLENKIRSKFAEEVNYMIENLDTEEHFDKSYSSVKEFKDAADKIRTTSDLIRNAQKLGNKMEFDVDKLKKYSVHAFTEMVEPAIYFSIFYMCVGSEMLDSFEWMYDFTSFSEDQINVMMDPILKYELREREEGNIPEIYHRSSQFGMLSEFLSHFKENIFSDEYMGKMYNILSTIGIESVKYESTGNKEDGKINEFIALHIKHFTNISTYLKDNGFIFPDEFSKSVNGMFEHVLNAEKECIEFSIKCYDEDCFFQPNQRVDEILESIKKYTEHFDINIDPDAFHKIPEYLKISAENQVCGTYLEDSIAIGMSLDNDGIKTSIEKHLKNNSEYSHINGNILDLATNALKAGIDIDPDKLRKFYMGMQENDEIVKGEYSEVLLDHGIITYDNILEITKTKKENREWEISLLMKKDAESYVYEIPNPDMGNLDDALDNIEKIKQPEDFLKLCSEAIKNEYFF